jgi:hypothetical protein
MEVGTGKQHFRTEGELQYIGVASYMEFIYSSLVFISVEF